MSRSPVFLQQKMLKKKAQQAKKPDPNKPQPKPLLSRDPNETEGNFAPVRNEPGKAILGSVGIVLSFLSFLTY